MDTTAMEAARSTRLSPESPHAVRRGSDNPRRGSLISFKRRPEHSQKVFLLAAGATFTLGSITGRLFPNTGYILSRKDNALNVIFAKWGLAWTMSGLFLLRKILRTRPKDPISPFDEATSAYRSFRQAASKKLFFTQISSLIPKTLKEHARYTDLYAIILYWGFVVHILLKQVKNITFHCKLPTRTCPIEDTTSFDISGHCFLMTLLSSAIFEELKSLNNVAASSLLYSDTTTAVVEFAVCTYLVFLAAIWHIMLFTTSAYFHTITENAVGMILGLAFWYVMYVRRVHFRGGLGHRRVSSAKEA